jgi:pectate lyase
MVVVSKHPVDLRAARSWSRWRRPTLVRAATQTIAFLAVALAAAMQPARAQIKAFPQAEGFGATALGGRGGDVYRVTNLNDDGVGSLRYGLANAPTGGRTIVFTVGGWITLNSKLGLTRNRVTIAGHTAPGGIGIRNGQFSVGGDDVVVRHVRFRPGKITNTDHDSINTNENAQRVIYDHISAEFSTDGGFDLQADEVTLQYSSVSFGLISHSTGGLIQSPSGGAAGQLSFHHNMFAHNETRNPKARAELIDWRDNVIYNFHDGFIAGSSTTDVNPDWRANFDGNTYISNSGGNAGSGGRPLMTGGRAFNYDLWYGVNSLDRDGDSSDDPISYTRAQAQGNENVIVSEYEWFASPFAAADVWQNTSPASAYSRVLQEFGATPWARDAVNQLIHDQVLSRTGQRISNENQLGLPNAGYPNLNPNSLTAPPDADADGMPDAWELKHGLAPNQASHNGDFDNDGYTNLEEYLNDLGAFTALGALEFDGTGRYSDWANWTRRWEPSRLDDVHIPTGTATVDAVGQRAGLLRVGSAVNQTGTLAVTNGWIEISQNLQIGMGGTGTVIQTGGEVRVLVGEVVIENGSFTLDGGVLSTPEVIVEPGGTLNLNGGVLRAGSVTGTIVNRGATLAPGASPGLMHVAGDLTLESGKLEIDIAGRGAGQFDRLEVSGALAAGGVLDVNLLGGFAPVAGDRFDLFDFNSGSGAFTLDLPALAEGLAWNTSSLLTTGTLAVVAPPLYAADFTGDGRVDAADLARWNANVGAVDQFDNAKGDANGDGRVDGNDFLLWQQQLGSGAMATVPEPAGGLLAAVVLGLLVVRGRR